LLCENNELLEVLYQQNAHRTSMNLPFIRRKFIIPNPMQCLATTGVYAYTVRLYIYIYMTVIR